MSRHIRKSVLVLIVVILISSFISSSEAISACGGFFCSNVPINQNAERIIFAVDSKHEKITAIVGINYVGEAKDFSWIVPVPSRPKLDVAETPTLDTLQAATNVQINPPGSRFCYNLYPDWQGGF